VTELVTGARGFIGSRLFAQLPDAVGYDIREDVYPPLRPAPSVVFHLGARVGSYDSHFRPAYYVRDNVLGTALMLEELERAGGVEHMVLASSCVAMFGGTPYAATKEAQEELCEVWCKRVGVTLSILRLHAVYGPGQGDDGTYEGVVATFAHALLRREAPTVDDDGLQVRDFVHVDDVVRALVRAADARFNGIAEVGTGRPTPIIDVATVLRDVLGGPLPVITGVQRQGDFRHAVADTRAARDGFGWEPLVTFEQGVREYAKSLQVGAVA
jgi:nucleoside-diphosphate-sugar epimerase